MASNYIHLTAQNIVNEHICCAMGKGKHQAGEQIKKYWLKQAFDQGMIFRKLDERGKVFIEIMPSEVCLKPIIAAHFMVIHCLWVSGKFKGQQHGKNLLNFAIDAAKKLNKNGICVLAGKDNYLTDSRFYKKFGFKKVDETQNGIFELMSLTFNDVKPPQIAPLAKASILKNAQGITVFTSAQCPFVPHCLGDLKRVAQAYHLEINVVQLTSHKAICEAPSPFGTFGVFLNETFITHQMLSQNGYQKIFDKLLA